MAPPFFGRSADPSALWVLWLGGCKCLRVLPDSIGQLSALRELELSEEKERKYQEEL